MSSAYHPQSNGRAEVAVKSVKRLMRTNTTVSGSLDTDRFLRAMLQLRNTPDPDCGVAPSEIVFGRLLRDNLSFATYQTPSTYSMRWRKAWAAKEEALRARYVRTAEKLNEHCRGLPPLQPGDKCFVQSQTGNSKKKWHHTGVVVEAQPYDKYVVKIDGTGRITTRNRQFLRAYQPFTTDIQARAPFCDIAGGPVISIGPQPSSPHIVAAKAGESPRHQAVERSSVHPVSSHHRTPSSSPTSYSAAERVPTPSYSAAERVPTPSYSAVERVPMPPHSAVEHVPTPSYSALERVPTLPNTPAEQAPTSAHPVERVQSHPFVDRVRTRAYSAVGPSSTPQPHSMGGRSLPSMLRKLRPHNKPGLLE